MSRPTLQLTRGKTEYLRGVIYEGRRARDLVTNNDELRFAIAHPDTMQRLVTKLSVLGEITLTEDGEYRIQLSPDDLSPAAVPLSLYVYEIELVDGNTGDQLLVERGEVRLAGSPFPTSDPELGI